MSFQSPEEVSAKSTEPNVKRSDRASRLFDGDDDDEENIDDVCTVALCARRPSTRSNTRLHSAP